MLLNVFHWNLLCYMNNKKYKNLNNNFATSHTMYSLGLGNNLWPLEVDKECVWHEV